MTSTTQPLKTTEEIERVLSRSKNSEEVYTLSMMLGYAYMRRNSSKQALRAFESAAQIKKQDAAALEGIVEASSLSGDYTTAVATQRRIAALRSTAQSRLKLGILLFEAKGYGEAATVFRKTIDELKDDGDFLAAVHYQAAILEKQSNIPDAIDVLGKAYKRYPMENSLALYIANLSNKLASCDATLQCISRFTWDMTNKKIAQNLAAIYERCESTDRAANVYKKLLQNAPNDEGARRTYLVRIGNLSFAQKKYAEAADYYLSALAEGTYIVPAGGIGHRVEGEKNPSPSERAELYDRLGNCRAMEKKYSYAARSWLAAYSLVPRSHYILQAMSASALAGDLIEASRLENKVRLSELSQEEKLRFWDQMAAIYWQKGDAERAADLYLKAYEIAPSARRQFALGHCYIQMGESERGVAAFKRAAAMDRGNIDYEVALARAESMAGNWNDAAKRFVKIIAKHPEMKDLYVDTAYAHLHMPNNDRAVMWLKRAIDVRNEELRTSYDDDLYREIYRLRQEVSTIDNIFDLDAYYTFTTDRRQWSSHTGGIERGAVPSLGGLRIALQPPTIGYRDGRIFQIYARLMWNTEPRTLKPNPKTLQGGAGVSYKPLRVVDWNFAIEDLFMLGASAQNNLLLYSGISWGIGTNLRPMKKVWNYTAIFSDVAFWAVKNRTFSAYGEYRQGATFNIADLILITPLLIGDTRYQVNKLGYNLYFEGGPGISIKGFLYRTNYMVELMNLELLVQYKWGTLIENTQGAENHAFRGLYVTMRYML